MTITRGGVVLLLGAIFLGMFTFASFSTTLVALLSIVFALAIFLLRHSNSPDLAFAIFGFVIGVVLGIVGVGTKVSDPVFAMILLSLIV